MCIRLKKICDKQFWQNLIKTKTNKEFDGDTMVIMIKFLKPFIARFMFIMRTIEGS